MLGLSATNIRYLDKQRDMADELFDGNIASEMTLGEAIVRGILNPPKYILSVFSYQKDLEKYEQRIRKAQSSIVRDTAKEYLEALRWALDKADGLDVIFDKHMGDRTGKYIVFCANYEAMKMCISHVSDWFSKVDKEPRVYSVYSGDPGTSKEFVEFVDDCDESHLRLLFCIDALNEGIHVDDVSGVILFRPTVSPIVYKQPIGRALSASKKKIPVIFDIVNNIDNLYSIDLVKEEMQTAITYYRYYGNGDDIVTDSFQVIDEVADCKALFDKLEESLSASWDLMYEEAKKYYSKFGDLEPEKTYRTESGYRLGQWVSVQRRVRNGKAEGFLDKERIDKLDAIGMRWESQADIKWEKGFEEAKKYSEQYGAADAPYAYVTPEGYKLGIFLTKCREKYAKGTLSQERIDRLNSINMIWSKSKANEWETCLGLVKKYYEEHGDIKIPAAYKADGIWLNKWLNEQKLIAEGKRKGKTLSEEQIGMLESVGFVCRDARDISWEQKCSEIKNNYIKDGKIRVPVRTKSRYGGDLYQWYQNQIAQYRNGRMRADRSEMFRVISL